MKFALTLILLTMFNLAYAKTVAMVTQISGNAFVFSKKGSSPLKYGTKLSDFTEVMVEDEGQLTIEDYHHHTYHLTGGSHVKFYKNVVEVKSGKIWVNSRNDAEIFVMQSVNGVANFSKGQFIFAYDNYKTKTQLLVLEGRVNFHNVLESDLTVEVDAGQFSLVDKDYNNGLPRTGTRVGVNSYKKMRMAFQGIKQLDKQEFDSLFAPERSTPARSIASVQSVEQKGKLIKVTSFKGKVVDPSDAIGPMSYYQEYVKVNKPPKRKPKLTPVRLFGGLDTAPVQKTSTTDRVPASVNPTNNVVNEINSAFEASLQKSLEQNKRHPDEVNKLINELKSYDQSYQRSY